MADIPPVTLVIKTNVEGESKIVKLSHQVEGLSTVAKSSSHGIAGLSAALSDTGSSALAAAGSYSSISQSAGNLLPAAQASAEGVAKLDKALSDSGVAAEKVIKGYSKTAQGLDSISSQLARMKGLMTSLAGGMAAFSGVSGIVNLADEYGQMASRIKMVTKDTEEYELVQRRLLATASETYRPLAEAQEVYIRTSDALKSLGYNTEQTLDVTDSLSYMFVTNAASGERAASAMDAFSRALQTGRIDGLAWRTIIAAIPSVISDLAETTGKTEEEIRMLGATGKLALTDLTEAFRKTEPAAKAAADAMPITLKDGFVALANGIQAYAGKLNDSLAVTNTAGGALAGLGRNVDVLANALIWAGTAGGVRFAGGIIKAKLAAITASGAFNVASVAAKGLWAAILTPIGVAAIAAISAAIYALKGKADETAKSLTDLAETTAQVFDKFSKMGDAEKAASLAGLKKEAEAATKAHQDLKAEISRKAASRLGEGTGFGGMWDKMVNEAEGATREALEVIKREITKSDPDFKKMAALLSMPGVDQKVKFEYLDLITAVEKGGKAASDLGVRFGELDTKTKSAANSTKDVNVELKKIRTPKELREQVNSWNTLAKALEKVREERLKEAAAATKQAESLRQSGKDLAQAAKDKAAGMRSKGLSEEEQQIKATQDAHFALNRARKAGMDAQLAEQRGDAAAVDKALQDAERLLQSAMSFAEQSGNDRLVESIGREQEKNKNSQADREEAKAKDFMEQAEATTIKLQEVVGIIKELKDNPAVVAMEGGEQVIAEIEAIIKAIDAIPAEKTITVTTNYVNNGVPPPVGGDTPGFARGGVLPGHSPHDKADNLLFMGTAGEYVVRRSVTRQAGALSFLERFNRLGMSALAGIRNQASGIRNAAALALPHISIPEQVIAALPRFADGGLLPTIAPVSAAASANNLAPTILNFPGMGEYPAQMAVDVQGELVKALKREALKRGRR